MGVAGQLFEKADDASVERVIAITGHHVTGAFDVEYLRRWNQLLQFLGAALADDVALCAPNQQRGHFDAGAGLQQRRGEIRRFGGFGRLGELGIPVPVPNGRCVGADSFSALRDPWAGGGVGCRPQPLRRPLPDWQSRPGCHA